MHCALVYTTADQVRAIAGVDEVDVTDKMMDDLNIGNELLLDLSSFLSDHETLHAAGNLVSSTQDERNVTIALTAYCKYWGAGFLLNYMQLSIPQLIRDGKNEMRRYENLDLDKLAQKMIDRANDLKDLLIENAGTPEAATVFSIMSSSAPAYDPVSNA